MKRISIKITGAQGQGINSVGELLAKGLKRAGYCVFGYREYMSLIKGGHSSYQLDVSDEDVRSTETEADILVCLDHYGLARDVGSVKSGGILLHQTPQWSFPPAMQERLQDKGVQVLYLPSEEILRSLKAKPILGNILVTAAVWRLLRHPADGLKELVRKQFGKKGKEVLEQNFACIDEGFKYVGQERDRVVLPPPNVQWKECLLLTGSQAMGLGIVHAGCRLYAGYPMTPSSPLLSFVADVQNETGMVVKQAEDEITAAQMMSGAMHMGTRAVTATSGGGFDLMTETASLNAEIENPAVFIVAQRPGPATGLPTWTAQGDLLLAVGSAHGEFARIVLAVSDAADCFSLMPEAFNLAEEWQTPVIVLTDKQIAEALFTQAPFGLPKTECRRGKLVVDPRKLARLRSDDRYDPHAKNGVSLRWLPGTKAATYCAQGDEHSADGTVDESAENMRLQMEKRMRKVEAIRKALPEPELYGGSSFQLFGVREDVSCDILLVSWGSNKGVILDALSELTTNYSLPTTHYLHYTYLWPLKTERLEKLMKKAKKIVLVEQNHQGQLGMLLKMQCGIDIPHKILKYDGRPFFIDEVTQRLIPFLQAKKLKS